MLLKKGKSIDFSKGNLSGIKANPITSIHHYSGRLLFGDAIKILAEMKKGNAYFNSFYNEKKQVFVNEIENLKSNQKIEFFTLPYEGGAYHELFYLKNKIGEGIGFYIDTASAYFVQEPWKPEVFYTDEHRYFLGDIISASLKKAKLHSKFYCKSKSILATECGDNVKFVSDEQRCLDHTKMSIKEVKKKLDELCYEPKCTFVNFVGTRNDKLSHDFFIDGDDFHTNFSIFELKIDHIKKSSKNEKILDFATYYSKYYTNETNLFENIKLSEKDEEYVKNYMKRWTSEQLDNYELDLDKLGIETDQSQAPIERFKDHIKDHGTTMGYYFIGNQYVTNKL